MKQMIQPYILQLFSDGFDPMKCLMFVLCFAAVMAVVVIVSILTSRYFSKRFNGNKKKAALCFVGVAFLTTAALICFFGFAVITFRGIILAVILALSSYEDIKARECDDYLHVMIVIAAFIGTEPSALPCMLLSGLLTGGLMLLPALIAKSRIGGADIKFASACSFMLGLSRGMVGLLIGMITAVLFHVFKKNKKEGFPLLPYLAVGYMAAYFI